MRIKLERVKLDWSRVNQTNNCNTELFTTIENGIERVLELIEEYPKQLHYLDLTAQYTNITKTSECITLASFDAIILFYDSCDRMYSVNVGNTKNILKYNDLAPSDNILFNELESLKQLAEDGVVYPID